MAEKLTRLRRFARRAANSPEWRVIAPMMALILIAYLAGLLFGPVLFGQ